MSAVDAGTWGALRPGVAPVANLDVLFAMADADGLLTTTVNSTLTIPTDDDALVAGLNGLGSLLTTAEWARAAIVAACVHVRPNGRGDIPAGKWSVTGFAALRISGLRSEQTIKRYIQAWESTGLPAPERGVPFDLPTIDFPASESNTLTATGDAVLDTPAQQAAWQLVKVTLEAVEALPQPADTIGIPADIESAVARLREVANQEMIVEVAADALKLAISLGVFPEQSDGAE